MRTLKYAGTLLIALCYYPLYQAGTVQAETLYPSTPMRTGLSIKSTDNNLPAQNYGLMLASMSQKQEWNHADTSNDPRGRTHVDAPPALKNKQDAPNPTTLIQLAPQETANQDKQTDELQCLALNIYFEARGESEKGKRAVGHVVMNRMAHRKFPSSVCAVVQQGGEKRLHRCQFSWWCDGRSDTPGNNKAWNDSIRIAREIYKNDSTDPTGGALWYHADYVSPYWRTAFHKGPKIGQHIFYLAAR